MSSSQSQSATATDASQAALHESDDDAKQLGSRDDWWGETETDENVNRGHHSVAGKDPAEYIAFHHILEFCDPICEKTSRPLSDPEFHLPKQKEISDGVFIDYRQHRHRRRVEPVSGRINWGESTSTAIPDVSWELYEQAVHNYLADRGVLVTNVEAYLQRAKRLFYDQKLNSHEALTELVSHVREEEPN